LKKLSPNVKIRSVAEKISKAERDYYWRRSEIYRKWLLEEVFEAESTDCTTIMVLPIQEGHTNYRDVELPCAHPLKRFPSRG
jgi:hypothetical protein